MTREFNATQQVETDIHDHRGCNVSYLILSYTLTRTTTFDSNDLATSITSLVRLYHTSYYYYYYYYRY